jgi:hypothetical protein
MTTTKRKLEGFYTYAWLRKDGTPYYIGKGSGDRCYSNRGRKKTRAPKDKDRILILKQNLTEEEAFRHEIYMIAVFGRKDLGTGILRNLSDGGEGSSGHVPSIEVRMDHSVKMKRFHENLSDDRKAEIYARVSHTLVEFYKEMPAEQKDERFARFKGENNPAYGRTGDKNPMFGVKRPDHSLRMSGENNPMYGVRMSGEKNPMYGTTGESCPVFGTKWWVNEDGENKRQADSPGPEWQSGRKWRN